MTKNNKKHTLRRKKLSQKRDFATAFYRLCKVCFSSFEKKEVYNMEQYADIIINISHEAVDRVFQYRIPEKLQQAVQIGTPVKVPFGNGNRFQRGYVVGISQTPNFDVAKIKDIDSVEEKRITMESQLIQLAGWIKKQYGSTMIQALKTVLPVKDKIEQREQRTLQLLLTKEEGETLLLEYEKKHYKAKERLLLGLLKQPMMPYEVALKKLNVTSSVIKSLEKEQVLCVRTKQVHRNPVAYSVLEKETFTPIMLREEQQRIVDAFSKEYEEGIRKTYLIHGVTGSGKTEVYMELIAKVLEKGKQAIVLIPEISLTYQTVRRFVERFGGQVTILNSRMSKGERYDQFMRAKNGEISIVIGPRSALFMPFQKLGLIVIDEEHEMSYKSESVPKYHARETAIERARMANASVVLGSATPSLESYTKAMLGEFTLFTMKQRAKKQAVLPKVQVVDLRQELAKGNRSMFSGTLQSLMAERLQKGEQIMLFLNRRGYSNFISCRKCGYVAMCPHCDVSLTHHRGGSLRCHYCGYERPVPKICPSCQSKYIAGFGTGTQKVEEAVKKMFPMSRVLRMDTDTTKGKEGFDRILATFSKGEADVLIGTQMIVKGHDFPKVTLVGILAADLSLHSSDFRAGERAFQLLTQASGRAGRGELLGDVVIQTYNPEHYSIVTASKQDYEAFYQQEIVYRRLMKYPPVYQMLTIFITSKEQDLAIQASVALKDALVSFNHQREEIKEAGELLFIGPSEASFGKIQDLYRRVLYVKHLDYEMLVKSKDFLEGYIEYSVIFKEVQVQFDFNAMIVY